MATTPQKKTSASGSRKASGAGTTYKSSSGRSTTSHNSANRKSTGKTQSRPAAKGSGSSRKSQDDGLKNEITMIICFALCILFFLCNFSIMGPFGLAVKGIMFGLFGVLSYVLPIAVFIGMLFSISNQGSSFVTRKILAGIVLLLCAGIFAEMIAVPMESVSGNLIINLFQESREGYKGGGLICGLLAYPMMKYLRTIGSILVLCVLIIIALVIITERSLINGIRKSSTKVYHTAKETAERHREERSRYMQDEDYDEDEEYEEEVDKPVHTSEPVEKVPRRKRKVSGVILDTELKKENQSSVREEMHEITIDDLAEEEPPRIHRQIQPEADEDEGFAFDLYPQIPEPRRSISEPVKKAPEPEIIVQEQMEFSDMELVPEPVGAPQKPPHSFGVKEGYQTPEEKAAAKMDAIIPAKQPPIKKYIFPSLSLLKRGSGRANSDSSRQLKDTALRLQQTLKTFGVNVTITDISQGPAVTRYEMQPEVGVKVSKIVGLADDIKLNLAATDIRIEAPIPGKAAVGIEVPNRENSAVHLRELLETEEFKKFHSNIAFAVGKDISGKTVVFDIGKMPHVLIAGATGSGKSVCINTLIMSILYKAHPDDVKLIMVDPKVVELSVYNGIPHLLIPVVTDPKKAASALQWAVAEMTERYKKFADTNVRDLNGYNESLEKQRASGAADVPAKLPQIVIIVDELADLMMVASNDVEEAIVRLAQLARAAGIHLVIATQRPSVDVITGLIKANMPSRIAFAVSSGVDSRTILDMNGAEKLLGKGDMLFYPSGYPKPARIQGAFVSDKEVSDVVDFLKNQAIGNVYGEELEQKIAQIGQNSTSAGGSGAQDQDELFAEAGRFIIEKDKASIGMLQRAFRIGFNRAARIMDQLSDAGVVGEEEGTKPRKVLMSMEQFENELETR